MPDDVQRGQDSKGTYYQAGTDGRKFRYRSGDKASRRRAKHLARQQQQAEQTVRTAITPPGG